MRRRPVAAFVPTRDRRSMLLATLRGLCEQSVETEIVVIDNGSVDGSVEAVKQEFPDVRIVAFSSNQGFGKAINIAVESYPADCLIFTNNDVIHEPRFVEALVAEQSDAAASVAGVLLKDDDPCLVDSAGVVVDATLLAFDYLHGLPVSAVASAPPPLGPTGGAALVPYSAFRAVGGFDERIVAYLEDVDLALRLRAAGLDCRLAADARALHRHSATLGSGSTAKNRLMGWSRGYMLRRYGVLRDPARAVRALASEAVICAGQVVIDHTISGAPARVHGWRAAGGLPVRPIPVDAPLEISLRAALQLRAARRSRSSAHAVE